MAAPERTAAEEAALAEARRNFANYGHYHTLFKVVDRDTRGLIPFVPRRMQRRIISRIVKAVNEDRPARFIGLKARQEGFSTAVQSFLAHRAFTTRNYHGLTVSHEEESAKVLHAMTEVMYENLPPSCRPQKIERERGKRLHLTNGSILRVATAGGDGDVGRSAGASGLHLSEVAFYPNAEKTLTASLQLVQHKPGTLVVLESTPNGVGNVFHNEWTRAVRGESDYEPLFFPWFSDPGYTLPGWTLEQLGELDDEETLLAEEHKLTAGQLAWRREVALKNLCRGDLDTLHQEYAANPEECFLVSGLPFFSARVLEKLRAVEPRKRGEFEVRGGRIRLEENEKGRFRCWQAPQLGHHYVLAVDPAGLVRPKEVEAFSFKRDAGDYTAMTVWDRVTQEMVAAWHGRMDLSLVGEEAAKIGKVYQKAMIVVETSGGYGHAVNQRLEDLGYGHIYIRTIYDQYNKPVGKKYGWDTTTRTRIPTLESLRDAARENPRSLPMAELHAEMRTFVTGDNGIPSASPGTHDDLVMAAAIGCEITRQHPQRIWAAA